MMMDPNMNFGGNQFVPTAQIIQAGDMFGGSSGGGEAPDSFNPAAAAFHSAANDWIKQMFADTGGKKGGGGGGSPMKSPSQGGNDFGPSFQPDAGMEGVDV